jgi:pilus assembly protein Flp/PilA
LPASQEDHSRGALELSRAFFKLYLNFQDLQTGEEGQDLVEYALLLTLISLALISGMNGIASTIGGVFSNISSSLA